VDPNAQLPPLEGPTELQVLELRAFNGVEQQRFFQEARRALRLPEPKRFKLPLKFYGGSLGWVYHKPTASLYARVPKCANNAIRLMLFAQFRGANLTDQQLTDTWRDADRPNAHASTGVLTVAGKPWNQRQLRRRAWTFVRDPLSHFVAGYTEALSRGRVNHGNRTWTVQQVRQFLKALVTGSNNSVHILGSERYHYMPMSRIANFQPLVAVGYMEHFDEHWAAVQTWLGQPQSQMVGFNRSRAKLVKHPTSDDPFGSSAAAITLISKDPAVQRALCFLLLPDFINLGYTMPQACREDDRMTAVLQWLDAPTEMVRASEQAAGPRPTKSEMAPLMSYMKTHLHGHSAPRPSYPALLPRRR